MPSLYRNPAELKVLYVWLLNLIPYLGLGVFYAGGAPVLRFLFFMWIIELTFQHSLGPLMVPGYFFLSLIGTCMVLAQKATVNFKKRPLNVKSENYGNPSIENTPITNIIKLPEDAQPSGDEGFALPTLARKAGMADKDLRKVYQDDSDDKSKYANETFEYKLQAAEKQMKARQEAEDAATAVVLPVSDVVPENVVVPDSVPVSASTLSDSTSAIPDIVVPEMQLPDSASDIPDIAADETFVPTPAIPDFPAPAGFDQIDAIKIEESAVGTPPEVSVPAEDEAAVPAVPVTVEPAVPVTIAPAAPVTIAPAAPVTSAPAAPVTSAAEVSVPTAADTSSSNSAEYDQALASLAPPTFETPNFNFSFDNSNFNSSFGQISAEGSAPVGAPVVVSQSTSAESKCPQCGDHRDSNFSFCIKCGHVYEPSPI